LALLIIIYEFFSALEVEYPSLDKLGSLLFNLLLLRVIWTALDYLRDSTFRFSLSKFLLVVILNVFLLFSL
jgi:hypothetical protein